MKKIQNLIEETVFGVCARLGEKFGMPIFSIRLFFVYASFLAFGSPIILYLILAFVMNFRRHLRRKNNSIWYY